MYRRNLNIIALSHIAQRQNNVGKDKTVFKNTKTSFI